MNLVDRSRRKYLTDGMITALHNGHDSYQIEDHLTGEENYEFAGLQTTLQLRFAHDRLQYIVGIE